MQICRTIAEIRNALAPFRKTEQSIAVIPTMGYLHKGHLSLVRAAREKNEITVATLFVNPSQFGPGEDFEQYPRDEKRDCELLEQEKTSFVFIPAVEEIYSKDFSIGIIPPRQSEGWCGATRPGHFQGVCTVVTLLFNIIQPQRAYFGQKDAQQLAVLRQMTKDLQLPIEITGCPIVRESDGLAMSSRNVYLSAEQREKALILSKTLTMALQQHKNGETSPDALLQSGQKMIQSTPEIQLDYLGIVDKDTFKPVQTVSGGNLIIGAIYTGKTRLIDNMQFFSPVEEKK